MKRIPLRTVEKITGIRGMTIDEARKLASPGFGCANQALALSMLTRLNTPTDWLRLQACLVHLNAANRRSKGA